jgi:hypothetical protein
VTDGFSSAYVTCVSSFFIIVGCYFGAFSCSVCLQAAEILSKEGISAEVNPFVDVIVSLVQYSHLIFSICHL